MEQTLGDFLREWRAQTGKTQKQVADAIGVDPQTISNIENLTHKSMYTRNLQKLATYMEQPIGLLLDLNRKQTAAVEAGMSRVEIPLALKKLAAARAQETGIDVDQWITAAVEAVMKLEGWKPTDAAD